ncbi:hypothetical protein ACFL1S_03255 [Pseudomonadota bacterium]
MPEEIATTYTPRNVSFSRDGRTYIDFSGRALAIRNRRERSFRIYSRDPDVQYEATCLFLLSCIGEFLDTRGMHRVHAMAMSVNGGAVLAILPMVGGKSTLGSALLKYPEFKFLSDDSPFISTDGRVHAFPLRLGLLPGSEHDIPEDQRRLELLSKTGVAWSRLRNARKLFSQSEFYRLILGRDTELNAATVRNFVQERMG